MSRNISLRASDERVSDLERQLAALSRQHPDISHYINAEADAQRQLNAANKRLAQFRSTFGESSQLPPDVGQLVEQLKLKEEEVNVLRLQDVQHADAETTLYDEIGKLSAAWESLQVQVTSKVFDLAAAEERIMKANLDVCPITSQRHACFSSHTWDTESQGRQQVLRCHARKGSRRKRAQTPRANQRKTPQTCLQPNGC